MMWAGVWKAMFDFLPSMETKQESPEVLLPFPEVLHAIVFPIFTTLSGRMA